MIFNKNNNGSEEIRPLATWTAVHDYWHIHQALLLAKRKVLKIIDAKTYKIALDHYLSSNYEYVAPVPPPVTPPTPEEIAEWKLLDTLVHHLQVVFVNFAYAKNINKDSIVWDNSGIKVAWNDQMRPAQPDTLKNVEDDLGKHAYEFLDLLIDFLNENKDTFTDFQTSVQGRKLQELFINDATEFSYYHNIHSSTSCFFEIADCIRRVQRNNLFGALTAQWYYRVLDYQRKRLFIEQSEITVATYADLAVLAPEPNEIVLVLDENIYYQFITDWSIYAFNVTELLTLVKPATVYLSIYNQLFSDMYEEKRDTKRLEMLQAQINYFENLGNSELAKVSKYIQELTTSFIDETTQVDTFSSPVITHNTFAL